MSTNVTCGKCHKIRVGGDGSHRSYCRECYNSYMNERRYRINRACGRCHKVRVPGDGKRKSYCQPCYNEWQNERRRKVGRSRSKFCKCGDPLNGRNHSYCKECARLRPYGLTKETFAAMFDRQGRCCLLCGRSESEFEPKAKHPFEVDHDHKTGIVRGILCGRCNTGLGHFDDDPDKLRRAADYIECSRIEAAS